LNTVSVGSLFVILTVILTLGVIFVNGWTDAPNAIATCVSTRAMKPENVIIMAAIFNFLGVFVMTLFNAKVASTICKMVDFGDNSRKSEATLPVKQNLRFMTTIPRCYCVKYPFPKEASLWSWKLSPRVQVFIPTA